MANRFQVVEVMVDGNEVRMQALNSHVSFTSIYWYYPQKGVTAFERLRIIDCKLQIVYDWVACQNMMFLENLMRIKNNLRVELKILDALKASGYIDENYEISNKGYEHIHQYERPVINIQLGHIKSESKLYKP